MQGGENTLIGILHLGHEAMMEKEQFRDFGIPSSPWMGFVGFALD
jgi:hypothetical protein